MTQVLFALSGLFADRNLTMVGHNLKYDLTILETVGLLPQCRLADTMLMSYVLDAGSRAP
jgi:DNA polymerase I-like protein with 3'-5' exonuclease and polymerase domains